MKKTLLGAHLSYKKESQLLGTIIDAVSIGATSGAFYISNSRGYQKFKQNLEIVKQAKEFAKNNKFDIGNFVVHSPLVGNLANIDKESDVFEKIFNSYLGDINMLEIAGIKYYNLHPGSSPNTNLGIKRIAKGINNLHKKTKGHNTVLLLETMMAKGNYIGKTFEQLNEIINLVKDKTRIGVCFDTCHVWDAGYDIKNNLKGVLKEFDKVIGLKFLKALHINDSKNELGSNKDRHEAIGKGFIGLKALKNLVNHPKLRNLPKALETPYGSDDFKRWKDEIKLLTK
ncbi:MAG: deoxyribonuclease IV [Mycoplasmataceae bacterium]|nr:deoxyribonuclease IV [Mycoplasmataceae bacterium]